MMTSYCITCDAQVNATIHPSKIHKSSNFDIKQQYTQRNPCCDMCERPKNKEITIECLDEPIKFHRTESNHLNFYVKHQKNLPKKIGKL